MTSHSSTVRDSQTCSRRASFEGHATMTATPWCKTPSGARSLLAFLITLLTIPAFSQTPIFPQLPVDFALFPSSTAAYADFNADGQVDEASPNGNNAIG